MKTMIKEYTVTAAFAVGAMSVSSVAQADINAVVEGDYDFACQSITLTANADVVGCEDAESSWCDGTWYGEPFVFDIPCGEDVLTVVEDLRTKCLDESDLVFVSTSGEEFDVTGLLCNGAADLLASGADRMELLTNGTFNINVANSYWISTMWGKFTNGFGKSLALPYATLNSPWASKFVFGMAAATSVPFGARLGCEDGKASAALTSSGDVVKKTGHLNISATIGGKLECPLDSGVAVSVSVDLKGRASGDKL